MTPEEVQYVNTKLDQLREGRDLPGYWCGRGFQVAVWNGVGLETLDETDSFAEGIPVDDLEPPEVTERYLDHGGEIDGMLLKHLSAVPDTVLYERFYAVDGKSAFVDTPEDLIMATTDGLKYSHNPTWN